MTKEELQARLQQIRARVEDTLCEESKVEIGKTPKAHRISWVTGRHGRKVFCSCGAVAFREERLLHRMQRRRVMGRYRAWGDARDMQ